MGGAKRRDAPKKRKPVSTKIKKKKDGKTETGSEKIKTCFERNEIRSHVQTNSEIPEIDLEAKEKNQLVFEAFSDTQYQYCQGRL